MELAEEIHLFDCRGGLLAAVEKGLEFPKVLAKRLIEIALMQGGCGVQHGEDEKLLYLEYLPPDLHDPDFLAQEGLHCEVAEGADHPGLDHLDLLKQKRLAGLDFIRKRIAVVRRAALDDICDVDIGPRKADRFQELVQQAAGGSHKGFALPILVESWGFTDEHDACVRVANAEDHLGPARGQAAAPTVFQIEGEFLEGHPASLIRKRTSS